MRASIERELTSADGVFGHLQLFDNAGLLLGSFCTAEDDWRDNQPKVSCIPSGTYVCRRVVSPKFGDVFEVSGVPNRSHILIHPGNTEEDVEGCILLGEMFGTITRPDEDLPGHPVRTKRAVQRSREALKRFMGYLAGTNQFGLDIRWTASSAPQGGQA